MKRRARRNHSPAFKAKVALAALKIIIGDVPRFIDRGRTTVYCPISGFPIMAVMLKLSL